MRNTKLNKILTIINTIFSSVLQIISRFHRLLKTFNNENFKKRTDHKSKIKIKNCE